MTAYTARLSRLACALADEPKTNEIAPRACHGLRDLLHADGAALTMETSTPYRVTLCTTDRRAALLEDLHDVLGEGPGMDAFDSAEPVRTALDRPALDRWPRFIPAAASIVGWAGLLWSIPLRTAGQAIGAITGYHVRPAPPAEPVADVQLLADLAASSLVRDPAAYRTVGGPADEDCWSSRSVVHQATGMLVGRLGVSAADALARLRHYAFSSGVELTEVALDVVERRLQPALLRDPAPMRVA